MLKEKLLRLREKISFKNIKEFKLKKYTKLFLVLFILIMIGLVLPGGLAYAGILGDAVMGVIYFVIYVVFMILFNIAYVVAWIGAEILNMSLNPAIMNQVFSNPGIAKGWSLIRDICNLLFLLLLLLVAFGTIVQSQKYNIKNSLPKLFLAVFLINFSNVIAGAIIDFGNILMYGILGFMCPVANTCFQDLTKPLMEVIDGFWNKYTWANQAITGVGPDAAIGLAVATVYTFMYGFILLAMAAFLLVRTAGLAILLILAPFAYFGEVMPGMEKIASKWWNNIWSYTLFGPIFALMLYISGELATTPVSAIVKTNPNLGTFGEIMSTIIINIIPLLFLLAIVPVTKELGLAGTDTILKNSVGVGEGLMKYAGGATDRFLARGAQDNRRGWNWGGVKGRINRARAYLSPGAAKRAWKATTAEQEHDYDVATGQYRDVRRPKFLGGTETHYKDIANRNDVARRIKDFATENGDEIVDMFKNATDIRDQQVLLKMGAAQGVSYKMAATQKDKAGNYYTEDAEGYNRFYNEKIKLRMGETEASKLGEDIGDLEEKKGNRGLKNLGHYNNTTSKWETYNYNHPNATIAAAHKVAHRADIVKSINRSNVLNTMKDLRASSFITKVPGVGDIWNETGSDSMSYFSSAQGVTHTDKIKPEEKAAMKIALANKRLHAGSLALPVSLRGGLTPDEVALEGRL